MKRYCDMEEISDGRKYGLHDMVKAGCQDCQGCSDCCRGMGNSIRLDPLDIYHLTTRLHLSFEDLLEEAISLQVEEGLIVPCLRMSQSNDACVFLSEEGRCRIHSFRPGICRIFPLGRRYEENGFSYFLQVNECSKKTRTKVRVSHFIDTENLEENQKYILEWHHYLLELQEKLSYIEDETIRRQMNLSVLQTFYQTPYCGEQNFYSQFYERFADRAFPL